jgi:WD40 repeat protein
MLQVQTPTPALNTGFPPFFSADKTIRLFDARTGEPWKDAGGNEHKLIARSSEGIAMEIHHDNPIRKLIRSPNGRVVIVSIVSSLVLVTISSDIFTPQSSSEDARIKLW